MRRKKLLRQVAAAAVALSMAVSLSAPAFATVFDLSEGGLVIKADGNGITVTQEGKAESKIDDNDEIVITGSYSSANGAMQTAEENRQEENQPVTPAKAPAKEETPKETQEAEDAPAAEKKQEQKDDEAPADPEQKTETENKDKNNDPDNEEKKEQNASAEGEEQPKPKAEAKAEAKASAEATASASDNASNGSRKAPARSSGEGERSSEGEHRGIIQIFANTLVKLTLKNATIDQPNAADTRERGKAAIDIQGSGNVEIKVEGKNTLNGFGNSAGIQKNDDVSTGKLTITAKDKDQTLNVIADVRGAAIGGDGYGDYTNGNGHGTKHIEINGGTVNTQGRIGSGDYGGAAEDIVITGDAVVNANGGIGGGAGEDYESNEGRTTSITISGNAKVTATDKVNTGNNEARYGADEASLAVIGGGYGGTAEVTISGNAVVNAKAEVRKERNLGNYGAGAVIGGGSCGAGSSDKKSSAKVTIEGNAQVTAENYEYGGGAGIGGGADGTGEVIIGGKAKVKATGSAEHYEQYARYGAGAAIGNGGTTRMNSTGTVQSGKNQFTTADNIQDDAEVEMTNIGHNGSNTVTKTRRNGDWVTKCSNHEFVETTVAPTCTESGYTVQKCSVCGEETGERTNLVAPLGHEYKNGVCIRCGAPEPQENGGSSSAAPNYTVTGAETYETSVVDGRYIIAVPSEDAALNAVLGDLRAIKAQGADVVVFRTRSRESSLVIDEMLAMGTDVTPFVLAHNGGEAQLTINGAAHNELIH